ncbi:hypothetical protein D047_3113B, partial [Vibrio parahaemolyticus VPTS-2010_2]
VSNTSPKVRKLSRPVSTACVITPSSACRKSFQKSCSTNFTVSIRNPSTPTSRIHFR